MEDPAESKLIDPDKEIEVLNESVLLLSNEREEAKMLIEKFLSYHPFDSDLAVNARAFLQRNS